MRHCKPRLLHPEQSCFLGWGQVPLQQRQQFYTCAVGQSMAGEARPRGWCWTPCGQALLSLLASSHSRQSPLISPAVVPCEFLGSILILSLQHPSTCRGINLPACGRGQTHSIQEKKAVGEGCCPPSSLPTSAVTDRVWAHPGRKNVQDQQPCGVQLRDQHCRGNGIITKHKTRDQPQATKSVRQNPE